jgi:hypothetical protein
MSEIYQFYLEPSTFNVVQAQWVDTTHVDVVFDQDVDADALSVPVYTLNGGLTVSGVTSQTSKIVRLETSPQPSGVYTVTVDSTLESADGGSLDNNIAAFLAPALPQAPDAPADILPVNLEARTHCTGQRIDLSWTNVAGDDSNVQWVRITRRQKNWAYDLTDPHDVVYNGPVISQFFDTGVLANPVLAETAIAQGANAVRVPKDAFISGNVIRVDQFMNDVHYEIKTVIDVDSFDVDSDVLTLDSAFLTSFDVGARVALSRPLQPQTYYYYNVLVADVVSPIDSLFVFADSNRVMGLSIAEMDSKESFFWKETPEYYRERDAESDGGNGYLDKWYSIMGCWLNLMRGQAMSLKLLNNDDETPYSTLSAKNISLGIEPEGFSYDYEIPRRSLLSLANVYKRRGACEGMIRTVRMFTQWEAACAEFTLGGCANGAKALSAWDGQSLKAARSASGISVIYEPDTDRNVLIDVTSMFDDHLWRDGMVIGPLGDIVCVQDNLEVVTDGVYRGFVFKEPVRTHRVKSTATAGSILVELSSLQQLAPGMLVQLQGRLNKTRFEIGQIDELLPETMQIQLLEPLQYTYVKNDYVGIQKNQIRFEQVFTEMLDGEVIAATDDEPEYIRVPYRKSVWVEEQWKGYTAFFDVGVAMEILKSDGDSVYVASGGDLEAPSGEYSIAIAKAYAGSEWSDRQPSLEYLVYNGNHTFVFNPLFDLKLKNTRWDPYSRLWQGIGSTLLGAWGAADVGLYVTTPVVVTMGSASAVHAVSASAGMVAESKVGPFNLSGTLPYALQIIIDYTGGLLDVVLDESAFVDRSVATAEEVVAAIGAVAGLRIAVRAGRVVFETVEPVDSAFLIFGGGVSTPLDLVYGGASLNTDDVTYVFDLDVGQPAPAVDAWQGYFLNPNQNQTRLFEILSNTATTVTVALDITELMIEDVPYYVLKPRDANRFRALVNRFIAPSREFANMDIDVKLLFSPVDAELP